jgi:mevalonate kinase
MPSRQPPKVIELKDISEHLVEAIVRRPKVDADTVQAFLAKARQKDLDQLEKQLAILKSSLERMGVSSQAVKELDELRMDIEDRWAVALETINGKLEEE